MIRLADRLPSLRAAGCVAIEMGVENADEAVLAHQNKRETRDQIRQAIQIVRDSGIRIASCNVMACNPGETIRGHYLQNQFLHDVLGLERIFVGNYFTLFPGSHFGDHPEQLAGHNLARDWTDYSVHDVTFVPDSLARQRPRATRPHLDAADVTILFPIIARAASVAGVSLSERLRLRHVITRSYRLFDGTQTLRQIAKTMAKREGEDPVHAFKTVTKLMIACAQVGLIADAESPDCTPVLAPWYARARKNAAEWYRRNRTNMFYFNDGPLESQVTAAPTQEAAGSTGDGPTSNWPGAQQTGEKVI